MNTCPICSGLLFDCLMISKVQCLMETRFVDDVFKGLFPFNHFYDDSDPDICFSQGIFI